MCRTASRTWNFWKMKISITQRSAETNSSLDRIENAVVGGYLLVKKRKKINRKKKEMKKKKIEIELRCCYLSLGNRTQSAYIAGL